MGKTMRTDRRGFLCGAAAFAAAVPISGFPAIVKRRGANMLLSHACIGCGNMALADLNGLRSHRDIHITALCDVDSEILEKARRLCPEARVYRNAFEMMAAEGNRIDSVNVSTPDHTHAAYILDALGRGLNVYGQKPLCHRLEESRRIESLAAEKGAVTQMGTQIAAWECDRQTAEALRFGKIGEVRHVWLFSNRRKAPPDSKYALPVKEDPVPSTLDWKTWLGDAAYRPYSVGNYHPQVWRKWRDFGSSWLGDLALHLLSPVWIGLELGKTGPLDVRAEISDDGWTPEQLKAFWPKMTHVTWTFPGVKASGGKPFAIEWCDGFGDIAARIEPKFLPPAFLQDIAAVSPYGKLPPQGRVIEGTEGWLLSTHFGTAPVFVMKDGGPAPEAPSVGPAVSHWHEYVDCCLSGGTPASSFAWAGRLSEMTLIGNLAQSRPGETLAWDAEKGAFK